MDKQLEVIAILKDNFVMEKACDAVCESEEEFTTIVWRKIK